MHKVFKGNINELCPALHRHAKRRRSSKYMKNIMHTAAYPIVVMKLVVNEPSENRKRRQLLPTPTKAKQLVNPI
jgi:hypothetical protein